MAVVYVGLGSNLGDREEQVLRAVAEMKSFARVSRISALRLTKPVGVAGPQPDFLNAVAELATDFSPTEVLAELLRIEREMGRVRTTRGAPREIDLDLIAYADEVIREPGLEVPHPRMHERRFVLEPLAELNPNWVHPVLKRSVVELLADLPK
ncbi:MAG: 2-amino-4-hydroxy-6-hydroxymethyldihydropteridine diphosphokinase [Pseudomonadota bacterium]